MEILVEIPDEKAKELNLTSEKISLEDLERKIALRGMINAMHEAQEAAKMYGIDKWTMEDVNQLIKEAKTEYEKEESGS